MKDSRHQPMHQKSISTVVCACAAPIFLGFAGSAAAQGVIAPPTLDSLGIHPAFPAGSTNRVLAASVLGLAEPPEQEPLWQLGPVQVRPHVLYRLLYGDGVPARPGFTATTAINEFYPGVLFALGQHWTLDYTPSFYLYSSSQFRNVTDQSVLLKGGTTYEQWTLGFSQGYISTDQPLIETSGQTSQQVFDTELSAVCQFNQKLALELGLDQNFRFMDGNSATQLLQDSRQWSTMDWLNYQFWPQLGLAIGAGAGYTELSTGADITFEQLQGRVAWRPADQFTVIVSGGADDRQFLNGNIPDLLNPILALSAIYQPFEVTTLSLNGERAVSPAYFQNQIVVTTGFSGSVSQRLLGKLTFTITGGYRILDYQTTSSTLSVNREDHYSFLNLRLSIPFLKRGTAALLYQISDNSSNEAGYSFSSTQVGLELGYRF